MKPRAVSRRLAIPRPVVGSGSMFTATHRRCSSNSGVAAAAPRAAPLDGPDVPQSAALSGPVIVIMLRNASYCPFAGSTRRALSTAAAATVAHASTLAVFAPPEDGVGGVFPAPPLASITLPKAAPAAAYRPRSSLTFFTRPRERRLQRRLAPLIACFVPPRAAPAASPRPRLLAPIAPSQAAPVDR